MRAFSVASAALAALALGAMVDAAGSSMGSLPPWWILHGVRPAGPEKDMGSYKAISFSEEQQKGFGINEDGTVKNQTRFDESMKALEAGTLGPGSFMVVSQETSDDLRSLRGAADNAAADLGEAAGTINI
mmetsp:Transcript_7057/g.16084  ORF Transcript_7057/g.16084 Transcript_7057/m.16084 type:complete len:130 (-) Transcript_7057:149-538(-)